MNAEGLASLLPLLLLAGGAVLILALIAIVRSRLLSAAVTVATLLAAAAALLPWRQVSAAAASPLFLVDAFTLFFWAMALLGAVVVALLWVNYGSQGARGEEARQRLEADRSATGREELYALLLLSTLGACVLAASTHWASVFLGLELLTVSLYGLIAFQRSGPGLEAGIKYLILGGFASALLLLGMALAYAASGAMTLRGVGLGLTRGGPDLVLTTAGLVLVFGALSFKLALVPFHMWTPDIYEGAPAPISAFVATTSKSAAFAFLLRAVTQLGLSSRPGFLTTLTVVAIVTMTVGNLLALEQRNVKRLLAYSSISQFGYLLVALLAGGARATFAAAFFLLAYVITVLAAFGVVSALTSDDEEPVHFDAYQGLLWRRPMLAVALAASMLSLAGMPLTAGFIGKFYVVTSGVEAALFVLVIALVINSGIGIYYYARLVLVLAGATVGRTVARPRRVFGLSALVVLLLLAALVFLGVYPAVVEPGIAAAASALLG